MGVRVAAGKVGVVMAQASHAARTYLPYRGPHVSGTLLGSSGPCPGGQRSFCVLRSQLARALAMLDTEEQKRLPRHALLSDDALAHSERTTQLGAFDLISSELFWQARQLHLEENGYLLRPRYRPDWKPSWIGTKDRKSTRLNSSHSGESRMPSSA